MPPPLPWHMKFCHFGNCIEQITMMSLPLEPAIEKFLSVPLCTVSSERGGTLSRRFCNGGGGCVTVLFSSRTLIRVIEVPVIMYSLFRHLPLAICTRDWQMRPAVRSAWCLSDVLSESDILVPLQLALSIFLNCFPFCNYCLRLNWFWIHTSSNTWDKTHNTSCTNL